jgi:hypothetical protein
MRSDEQLIGTPPQRHTAHPDECFVCRRTFPRGVTCTHEETGARTCSPLCVKTYQRWWLRKTANVQLLASATDDADVR